MQPPKRQRNAAYRHPVRGAKVLVDNLTGALFANRPTTYPRNSTASTVAEYRLIAL
jgi:hypothetical protein